VVHQSYLREFHRLAGVTVVVLNQADRLSAVDLTRLLADLRRLLERDELPDVPVLATSAVDPNGHTELRALLEETVAARHAALERLNGDVDQAVAGLSDVVGPPAPKDMVDRATVRSLTDALASSAGVPAVVSATERAYRHRATGATGWPLVRWVRRLRPDPLRRLHLPEGSGRPDAPLAATSVPDPDEAQRAGVGLAIRAVANHASREMPAPWPAAVTAAARSRLDDVPDALDRAVAGTDLGLHRAPLWWRFAGALQWLATLAAIAGIGWLLTGYAVRAVGLPPLEFPKVGQAPWPTLLLLGGLLVGVLLALLVRPLVAWGARRAARRAETRLKAAVTEVAREYVVAPVREVLHAYADARELLTAAGRS
jgi:hypothetical protein